VIVVSAQRSGAVQFFLFIYNPHNAEIADVDIWLFLTIPCKKLQKNNGLFSYIKHLVIAKFEILKAQT
jgi:hypothetical protein